MVGQWPLPPPPPTPFHRTHAQPLSAISRHLRKDLAASCVSTFTGLLASTPM